MGISPQATPVDVLGFVDAGAYLRAALTVDGRAVKLQHIARRAGFASPSLLSMILSGKRRLSPWAAERLAKALALRGSRKSYFLAMERAQNGRSPEERIEARERMLAIKSRIEATPLKLEQYRFVATWFYPVIYVLAGMRNMNWDPAALAKRLGRGVTKAQVAQALEELVSIGILAKDGDGFVRALASPKTAEDVRSLAVQRYHRQMIELAAGSLSTPLELRELNGLTAAIPKRLLPEVKERIRQFRRSLNDFLEPFEEESSCVYQVNLHLFPLTEEEG